MYSCCIRLFGKKAKLFLIVVLPNSTLMLYTGSTISYPRVVQRSHFGICSTQTAGNNGPPRLSDTYLDPKPKAQRSTRCSLALDPERRIVVACSLQRFCLCRNQSDGPEMKRSLQFEDSIEPLINVLPTSWSPKAYIQPRLLILLPQADQRAFGVSVVNH